MPATARATGHRSRVSTMPRSPGAVHLPQRHDRTGQAAESYCQLECLRGLSQHQYLVAGNTRRSCRGHWHLLQLPQRHGRAGQAAEPYRQLQRLRCLPQHHRLGTSDIRSWRHRVRLHHLPQRGDRAGQAERPPADQRCLRGVSPNALLGPLAAYGSRRGDRRLHLLPQQPDCHGTITEPHSDHQRLRRLSQHVHLASQPIPGGPYPDPVGTEPVFGLPCSGSSAAGQQASARAGLHPVSCGAARGRLVQPAGRRSTRAM